MQITVQPKKRVNPDPAKRAVSLHVKTEKGRGGKQKTGFALVIYKIGPQCTLVCGCFIMSRVFLGFTECF